VSFPTIPTTASGDLLGAATTTAVTTHTFPSLSSLRGGAGPQAGDLLIAVCVQYQGGTANAEFSGWGASFTEIKDDATATALDPAIGVAYKVATGSESGTFTVTSAHAFRSVNFLMRIPAGTWHGTTAPEVSAAVRATNAVADVASFDPANWAAEDTLWVAVAGHTETSTTGSPPTLDTPPTNYSGELIVARNADAVGHITAGVAFRQVNASAEDAGTWGVSNATRGNGIAAIIAVRPAVVLSKAQVAWAEFEIPAASSTPKAGTDTGAGGTQASTLKAALPRTETGSGGVQASTLKAVLLLADAGTGTDTAVRTVSFTRTESGSGTDVSSVRAAYPLTQTGTGVDSTKAKVSAVTQTGSGTDSSVERTVSARTETGVGAETSRLTVPKAVTDAGAGADVSTEKAVYQRADAGSGADVSATHATHTRTETGTGVEASAVIRRYAVTQTGAGVDVSTQKAVYTKTEAGTGTDGSALQAGNAKHGTDSGTGVDSSLLVVRHTRTDAGTGADSSSVAQGALSKAGSDAGTGADSSTLRASLSRSDTGACNDLRALHATLSRADAGVSTQASSLAFRAVDTGTSSDVSLARAALLVSQAGSALDVAALRFILAQRIDAGAGDDHALVFKGGLVPDRMSASVAANRVTSAVGLNRGGEGSTIEGDKEEAEVTRWP